MSVADSNEENVDFISDIQDEGTGNSQLEDNGGTREAGTDNENKSTRQLLEEALGVDRGDGRDDKGRFTKAEQEAADAAAAATDDQQQDESNNTQQQLNLDERETAALSALPADMQDVMRTALSARETAFYTARDHATRAIQALQSYNSIAGIIEPRREAWAINGTSPEQAISQVLALSDFAGKDPAQFIQWFADQHNIDLLDLGENYIPPDPQIAALQQEIAALKNGQQQFTNEHQQQQHSGVVQQIDAFARETGSDGKPLRPFFNAVAQDLLHIIPGIKSRNPNLSPGQVLDAAYNQAIWSNETTRKQLLAAQKADSMADANRRKHNARTAGSSVATAAPVRTDTNSVPTGSVRETLEHVLAQQSAGNV